VTNDDLDDAAPAGDQFAQFDAAYVLGALPDADRIAFEDHLRTCRSCTQAVEALRPVTMLLASASPTAFEAPGAPDAPAPELLPALLRALNARRRRRRVGLAVVSGLAAACLVLATALIVGLNRPRHATATTGHAVAMTAVLPTPIHATAAVTRVSWGTQISLRCTYGSGSAYPAGATYRLVVTDRHGTAHILGDWRVVPGAVTTYESGTSLPPADIASVTITTNNGLAVLSLQR
jgi:hypothetical protein